VNYLLPPDSDLKAQAAEALEAQQKIGSALNAALILDAGDMQPPRAEIVGRGRELSAAEPSLIVTGAAASKYFSRVHTLVSAKKIALETVTRDMSQYNEGCELTRMDLKIANRMAENLLYEAELWATVASSFGRPYPSRELDKAWRQTLFCQHHDAVTGCGTDIVFIDILDCLREAVEIAAKERDAALAALASTVAVPKEFHAPYLVFNSLPWRRDGVVRAWLDVEGDLDSLALVDRLGREIPYEVEHALLNSDDSVARILAMWAQKEMEAAGYDAVHFAPREIPRMPYIMEGPAPAWIENEFVRLSVDAHRGGGIVSLIDKESGKEFINQDHPQPGNDVMLLTEGAGDEPAWRLLTTGEKETGSEITATVTSMEGAVSSRLIVKSQGPGPCNRYQEIRIYRELPYIDCLTILENYQGRKRQVLEKDSKQVRDLYLLAFPLNLQGAIPVLEDRFYAKAYRKSYSAMEFFSSFNRWDSQHAMNSCHRWMDVSWTYLVRFLENKEEKASLAVGPSEAVIGQDKHRALRDRLIMHLARHGVTCTPRFAQNDPEPDRLFRQCSFSIGTAEENAYTHKLLEQNAAAKAYYEKGKKETGWVSLVVEDRPADSKAPPVPVFLFAGRTDALLAQSVEDMIRSTVAHRWDCPMTACFLSHPAIVEDFGLAVMNRGSILCSLEADQTLALALMHTAPYPSPQTPWNFDFAEKKNHVFQFRLMPHRGDWRLAEIPRRAMEYNHEPHVLRVQPQEGSLPAHKSFISIEPGNILVSAVKPQGFPEAEYRNPNREGLPIIARFYEAHGEESNLWLEYWQNLRSVKAVRIDEAPLNRKREVFREDQFIRALAHANEILTLQMDYKPEKGILAGNAKEPNPPCLARARYWRTNEGAAPMGFLPLSLSLRGDCRTNSISPETRALHFDLVVVNNSSSQGREGEAVLLTPPYWRAIPSKIKYRLQAGGYQITPLHLFFDGPERDGFLKAKTEYDGIALVDLAHIGRIPELDLSMTLTEEAFNIHLKNPFPYDISGFVSLIGPVESWPSSMAGEYSLSSLGSPKQNFSVPAGGDAEMAFPVTESPNRFGLHGDHHWLIIKLAAHYAIRYYHVRLDGGKSEGLGRILHPLYERLPNA